MLSSLIQAHKELEGELERAISDDSAVAVIESIDAKIANLDNSIRQFIPNNSEEARIKLQFFLARILVVGGGVISDKDIATIEELFEHVLSGATEQRAKKLISNKKS